LADIRPDVGYAIWDDAMIKFHRRRSDESQNRPRRKATPRRGESPTPHTAAAACGGRRAKTPAKPKKGAAA